MQLLYSFSSTIQQVLLACKIIRVSNMQANVSKNLVPIEKTIALTVRHRL